MPITLALHDLLAKGQAAMNLRLTRQGYTPEAQRALEQSLLWHVLCGRIDGAAIAGDVEAIKAAYRVAWAVADGPTTGPTTGGAHAR